MDEDIGRGHPIGHAIGESLHTRARLARKPVREADTQLLVATAQAHDLRDIVRQECGLDRAGDVANAPAAAGDENDLPVRRKSECRSRVVRS